MKYLTFSGNNLIQAAVPDSAHIYYPNPPLPGIARRDIPAALRRAVESPLGMPPLRELVNPGSKILIAFDDNCQPFPPMQPPDIRQVMIEELLDLLTSYGVDRGNVRLICAVALHRKMKPHELRAMLGDRLMREFHPERCTNFDAEDPAVIVRLGETARGEPVETHRAVVESDLVIYVDTIQIPLNGGHKSVAVGLGTYRSIAAHHAPQMTATSPHVMQPHGSEMHGSIERQSRVISQKARIMVIEAAMNGATYPDSLMYVSKPPERLNPLERALKAMTPLGMSLLPETARYAFLSSIQSAYSPIEINAGTIDDVHPRTLAAVNRQLEVPVEKQFDTLVFGLPDLSPYSVGTRINPVLVVSDVLGYICNWFYSRPIVKRGGVVIILNPAFEFFHSEYHVAYRRFYDEVLPKTRDPFVMQSEFQEAFATDPELVDCYRNRYAHHGFHPFTVWYWATYPLQYLSDVILVGPEDDRVAKRLGVSWASSLERALARARERSGGGDVVGLTIPPFLYVQVP
jgi:hypothetical protein